MHDRPDHSRLPTGDALRAYADDAVVLHIPGHGSLPPHPLLADMGLEADPVSTARSCGIMLGDLPSNEYVEENPDRLGQKLAADAWHADRAWWLLGGASQGNQAALLGLAGAGDVVAASRGSHVSVVAGLVLSGADVQWVQPGENEQWETLRPLGAQELQATLQGLEAQDKRARCVIVTSPTYFGEVADIPALAEIAHNHGCALWVDGSWGSHFGFHSALPANPLTQGADLMLASTHKHAGSLRGSAILLARETQWMSQGDHQRIERALQWLSTTSPSFLMRMSLDAARWQQVNHGEQLWAGVLGVAEAARARLAGIPGLLVADQELPGDRQDRTRLILDVSPSGWSGIALERQLARHHRIFIELGSGKLLVCMVSHSTTTGDIERLAQALEAELPYPPAGMHAAEPLGHMPEVEMVRGVRTSALGANQLVDLEQAEGGISAEMLAVYPPGIPLLVPGCRIDRAAIEYLHRAAQVGARLYGNSDSSGRQLLICSE